MDAVFECIFKGLFGCLPALCEFLCQNLGPQLGSLAECMFRCVSVGCVPLMELICNCWCRSTWYYSSGRDFKGFAYIFLGLLLCTIVIATLALGIYALSQYIQDFNPTVNFACAILNQSLTGQYFSALPITSGRNKGLQIVGALSANAITVISRCFNGNKGSAKFYVDGKYAAYTKIDHKLYTCNGNVKYQLDYSATLRVLNADNSLLVSTDKTPTTGSITTFKDASGVPVAMLRPSATASGLDIQILASRSPAADPLLLLAAAAFAQFTATGYDECNGFVLSGGIIDLVLLSILFVFGVYMLVQCNRKRDRLPTLSFYEPQVVVQPPPLPPTTFSNNFSDAAHTPSAPPSAPVNYKKFPPQQPDGDRVGLLFQADEDFATSQSENAVQPPAASAPYADSTMAAGLPQGTPLHIDLREALKPVGYTRLKRYLALHNIPVGLTLLKDELITLAIIYRGQIDFSPLVAEVSNVFTQQPR
jgi:hypothetical protein